MFLARIRIYGLVLRTSKCDADGKVPDSLPIALDSEQVLRPLRQLKLLRAGWLIPLAGRDA